MKAASTKEIDIILDSTRDGMIAVNGEGLRV